MKKIITIGILSIAFSFYNCKDKKTQQEAIVIPKQTDTIVSQETDTTIQVNAILKDDEKNESEVVTQTTTTTEITKTINAPEKVESTTNTISKPIIENKIDVVTNDPVETKNVTKTEVIITTPVETETEPVVVEKPKEVDKNAWVIPTKYRNMKNPTDASDKGALLDAKVIYSKECQSCHGKKGLGDGSKAEGLKGNLGDFSDPEFFKEQTEGELFYKIKMGRDDMPAFGKKLSGDEDIWLVINYIKTLSK